jgi:prevent-host-death family protein
MPQNTLRLNSTVAVADLDCVYAITYHNSFFNGWFMMHTLTASEARSNLYRLIDDAAINHEPIVITGKRNNAVLLSADDWASIQETIYLLSIPGMRESIREGMSSHLDECSNGLTW